MNHVRLQGEKCEQKSQNFPQDFFELINQTVKALPEKPIKGNRSVTETCEVFNEKKPEHSSSFTHVNKKFTESLLEQIKRMK